MTLTAEYFSNAARLLPAAMVGGLGDSIEHASSMLSLDRAQLHPSRDGGYRAELDVPAPGTWHVRPERSTAAWISRRPGVSLPVLGPGAAILPIDLVDAVRQLHRRGMWTLELALYLQPDGWRAFEDARDALVYLVEHTSDVEALAGVFDGGERGTASVEIHRAGSVRSLVPADAERWLLVAHGFGDDD